MRLGRDTKPHTDVPKIVAPYKANPAFNKAEQNLGLKVLRIDEREDFRAGVPAIADAIGCTWGDDHSVYSTPTFAISQPSSLLVAGRVVMNYTDELGSTMAGRRALDRSYYQVARASIGQISTSVSPRMQ